MSSSGELERYGIRYAVERAQYHSQHWRASARKCPTSAQANAAETVGQVWSSLGDVARAAVGFLLDDATEKFARHCAEKVELFHALLVEDVEDLRQLHGYHPHDPVLIAALESVEEAHRVSSDIAGYVRSRTLVEGVGP